MSKLKQPEDRWIRYAKDITPRPGFSILDEARLRPGPSLARTYEGQLGEQQSDFPRNPETILCPGAGLGIDRAGVVHHFRPGLKWIGFLVGNGETNLTVQVRGSAVLRLEGATDQDRGKPVFCSGPNSFSLSPGGAEIGRIRYVQDARAAVAFKREADAKPLDMRVDQQR